MSKQLSASLSWVAHFWPQRYDTKGRAILRWHMQNAKVARWLAGGRYPSHYAPTKENDYVR